LQHLGCYRHLAGITRKTLLMLSLKNSHFSTLNYLANLLRRGGCLRYNVISCRSIGVVSRLFMKSHSSEQTPFVIAIVEDEENLRLNVALFLEAQGFRVWTAGSAEDFYRQLAVTEADLVIVDLGLPGEDGLALITHLNTRGRHPIIVMTARGAVQDRIAGLEAGIEHYFVKPVNLYELAAAIQAVLRKRLPVRAAATAASSETDVWVLVRGEAVLITPTGVAVRLTSGELHLLEELMNNAEKILSKSQLLEHCGQDGEHGDFHRIEVLVSRLRAKVSAAGQRLPLRSVFGRGLVFVGSCSIKS